MPGGRKRKYHRFTVSKIASCSYSGRQFLTLTQDLGMGGLRIRTPAPLPLGEDVEIFLTLGDRTIRLKGRAVHCQGLPDGQAACGLRLSGISPEDLETLKVCLGSLSGWPDERSRNPRKSSRKNFLAWKIILVLFLGLMGCNSYATAWRVDGYRRMQKGFEDVASSPELHKVFFLPSIKVHVVGSQQRFDHLPYRQAQILGYATPFEIWVLGKEVDGKIVLNWAVLGHELAHILNFHHLEVANPDEYEVIGAYRAKGPGADRLDSIRADPPENPSGPNWTAQTPSPTP